jgi:hypothetical protein
MKLKQNVAVRFVCETEEYNRIIAVYSLLITIDKRINKETKSAKKASSKKTKEKKSQDIYHGIGSRKKRALYLSNNSLILNSIALIYFIKDTQHARHDRSYITQSYIHH